MVLVGNGMQAELGKIEAELVSDETPAENASKQQGLNAWLQHPPAAKPEISSLDPFAARPLMRELISVACAAAPEDPRINAPTLDDMVDVMKEVSLTMLEDEEAQRLAEALSASVGGGMLPSQTLMRNEEEQLAEALAASVKVSPLPHQDTLM